MSAPGRGGPEGDLHGGCLPGTAAYLATVTRVAYGSTITDNVVTYTTELEVDNPTRTLRPGMTAAPPPSRPASASPAAGAQHGAALHAQRRAALAPSRTGRQRRPGGIVAQMPRAAAGVATRSGGGPATAARWAAAGSSGCCGDGAPWRCRTVGASDGKRTEVSGSGLNEASDAVITDQHSGRP